MATALTGDHLLVDLLAGRVARVTCTRAGALCTGAAAPAAVLPGAFHPAHDGHHGLALVAAELLGRPVSFELSVRNVDKPALTLGELTRRVGQFSGLASVEVTDAPSFLTKSRMLPGVTFVVGADTAQRVVDPRYHAGSEAAMHAALSEIRARGCHFLVAGRAATGRFRSLADIAIPAPFTRCFDEIPERLFRRDVSSTELRRRA